MSPSPGPVPQPSAGKSMAGRAKSGNFLALRAGERGEGREGGGEERGERKGGKGGGKGGGGAPHKGRAHASARYSHRANLPAAAGWRVPVPRVPGHPALGAVNPGVGCGGTRGRDSARSAPCGCHRANRMLTNKRECRQGVPEAGPPPLPPLRMHHRVPVYPSAGCLRRRRHVTVTGVDRVPALPASPCPSFLPAAARRRPWLPPWEGGVSQAPQHVCTRRPYPPAGWRSGGSVTGVARMLTKPPPAKKPEAAASAQPKRRLHDPLPAPARGGGTG